MWPFNKSNYEFKSVFGKEFDYQISRDITDPNELVDKYKDQNILTIEYVMIAPYIKSLRMKIEELEELRGK